MTCTRVLPFGRYVIRTRSRYLRPLIHLVRVVITVRLVLRFQLRPRRCVQTWADPASIAPPPATALELASAVGTTITVQATNRERINSFFITNLLDFVFAANKQNRRFRLANLQFRIR